MAETISMTHQQDISELAGNSRWISMQDEKLSHLNSPDRPSSSSVNSSSTSAFVVDLTKKHLTGTSTLPNAKRQSHAHEYFPASPRADFVNSGVRAYAQERASSSTNDAPKEINRISERTEVSYSQSLSSSQKYDLPSDNVSQSPTQMSSSKDDQVSHNLASSPMSDSKWTSFDDSEGDAEEALSRNHSESEHQNLLADADVTSDGGDDTTTLTGSVHVGDEDDPSLVITPELRVYYEGNFKKLRGDILDDQRHRANSQGQSSFAPDPPTQSTMTNALWGKDVRVKNFFEESKLSKNELSQIWALSDANTDGWLNLDEFCVAMHLIVRRVQAKLPVPLALPAHLRPPLTPPLPPPMKVNSETWTQFDANAKEVPPTTTTATTTNTSATQKPVLQPLDDHGASLPPTVSLKTFTDVPPEQHTSSRLVQPKPRRVTPEFLDRDRQQQQQHQRPIQPSPHSSSVPPSSQKLTAAVAPAPAPRPRTSVNEPVNDTMKITAKSPPVTKMVSPPAAVPKGPPPKPPPRPAFAPPRHSRSVSLDLTKEIGHAQRQDANANVWKGSQNYEPAAAPEAPCSPHRQQTDAQVQTSVSIENCRDGGDGESSRNKRHSSAPMLDLSMDLEEERSEVPERSTAHTPDDSKDWKKRCERLRVLNSELERELKKLSETRIQLQMQLKRLEKF